MLGLKDTNFIRLARFLFDVYEQRRYKVVGQRLDIDYKHVLSRCAQKRLMPSIDAPDVRAGAGEYLG